MILALLSLSALADSTFDHSHADFGAFLQGAVSGSGVDYGLLASRRARLDSYLMSVAAAPVGDFSADQKIAFYVNAYNAYTLKTILDELPIDSILKLDDGKVWDVRQFAVGGETLTLNGIEHGKARKLADGRIHSVLNCASKGCPPLPPSPLVPTGMEAQLDAAAGRWAATNAFTMSGTQVGVNKIFDWYSDDFTDASKGDIDGVDGKEENALWFLVNHVDEATAAKFKAGGLTVTWQDYDWSLNAK